MSFESDMIMREEEWHGEQPAGLIIKDNCFLGYKGHAPNTVRVPDGVRRVAAGAFGDEGVLCDLEKVSFPESVEWFGDFYQSPIQGEDYVVDTVASVFKAPCPLLKVLELAAIPPERCCGLGWVNAWTSFGDFNLEGMRKKSSCCYVDDGNDWELGMGAVTVRIYGKGCVPRYAFSTFTEYSDGFGSPAVAAVEIGQGVEVVNECAFRNCPNLQSITLADSVREIGPCAFSISESVGHPRYHHLGLDRQEQWKCKSASFGFRNFKTLDIPGSVKLIGSGAFSGWSNLTNLTLGEGVKEIQSGAFSDCPNLSCETHIPDSVEVVYGGAFKCYDYDDWGGEGNRGAASWLRLDDGQTQVQILDGWILDVRVPESVRRQARAVKAEAARLLKLCRERVRHVVASADTFDSLVENEAQTSSLEPAQDQSYFCPGDVLEIVIPRSAGLIRGIARGSCDIGDMLVVEGVGRYQFVEAEENVHGQMFGKRSSSKAVCMEKFDDYYDIKC